MKPSKEAIEAYKEMAKASPASMKTMIEENLKATCDKYAGHEDRLDDCIDYLTECAKQILGSQNGEVDNYVEGFKALQQLGYDKYVSFECGCGGDRATLVTNAVNLLRAQWEEAQA